MGPPTVGEVNLGNFNPVSEADITKATEEAKTKEVLAREEGKQKIEFKWGPLIKEKITLAESAAKERGEVLTDLARMEAALPGLSEAMRNLKRLAQIATHTQLGQIWNAALRELGFGATEGGTARAQFIAIVDNQVLPLLKPTFGGAFTVEEGDNLKATMGDPDLAPAEKMAQLNAFIAQKVRDIRTKKRQLKPDEENQTTKIPESVKQKIPDITQEEWDNLTPDQKKQLAN